MSVVAVVKTSPRTVLRDYHRVMNLAGYQGMIARDVETALKANSERGLPRLVLVSTDRQTEDDGADERLGPTLSQPGTSCGRR